MGSSPSWGAKFLFGRLAGTGRRAALRTQCPKGRVGSNPSSATIEGNIMIRNDYFKREIKVGDYVAASVLSYKRSDMRVGKVTKIHDTGNISIRLPEPLSRWNPRRTSVVGGNNCLILAKETIPEDVLQSLE